MSSGSDQNSGSKNPKAQVFFQYGNDAVMKSNFDYAIQMYREACKVEPGNLPYRQMLRLTEQKKFGRDPSKVGMLAGARTQTIRHRARSARSKGKFAETLEICEEAFVINPWDAGAAREAAEAAEEMGFKQLAQWLVESVAETCNDADFHRYAAHVHEINASFPKAIQSWERVKKINPHDQDALHMMNALSASATIHRSGLGDEGKKSPAGLGGNSGPESAAAAELEEMKKPKLSPEQRWMQEIKDNPEQVGPYLHLADHLKQRDRLDDAEKVLARGVKAVPDDPSLQTAHAEIQIARLQRALASWTQRAKERSEDPAAQDKVRQIQTMLDDYEIKEFRRRIKLYPGDLDLHYDLGVRLARSGKHKEAIASFQQARSSPKYKVESLHQAGLSFEAENALKLAERSYQDALKVADPTDLNVMNALHYRLGRVAEGMGNTAMAEEHYNEIAANDYSYLDVAARLRGLG